MSTYNYYRSVFVSALVLGALLLGGAVVQAADPPIPWNIETLLQRIPPLKHDPTGRLPMVTWEAFVTKDAPQAFNRAEPLPAEMYRELAKRGLAQCIRMNERYIPVALAMQQAGVKVIVMEGGGGDVQKTYRKDGQHQFPKDYQPKGDIHGCPLLLDAWNTMAQELRGRLQKFRDAGVTIDAAWMDWEHEPWWMEDEWQQSRHCLRCQQIFPPGVLDDHDRYRAYIIRLRQQLYSTYLAAPILEYYPKCSITNWTQLHSSPEYPNQSFGGGTRFPPMDIGLFTASNPVAYGVDTIYKYHWSQVWGAAAKDVLLDAAHMDRVYTWVMLTQTSRDAAVSAAWAPEKRSIPWVARYCPDEEDAKVPIMSRDRYREVLRHLFLRGAQTLQIFNANRPKTPNIETEEVEDAVAVYDEMLEYRPFLEHGAIMCCDVPAAASDAPIWSGLRLDNTALIRAYTQGPKTVPVTITPWKDGPTVTLNAPQQGATYLLTRQGEKIAVVKR